MALFGKKEVTTAERWRAVFGSPLGKEVLEEMLIELHFFDTLDPTDMEQVALHNYAKSILYRLGFFQDKNVSSMLDDMFKLDYADKE